MMNSKIKIKAWLIEEKDWYDLDITDSSSVGILNANYDHILCEYTRLNDVDGSEVYDGDILEYPSGLRAEVYWNNKYQWSLRTHYVNEHGYHKNFMGTLMDVEHIVPDDLKYKVIGNIHPNPELIVKEELK